MTANEKCKMFFEEWIAAQHEWERCLIQHFGVDGARDERWLSDNRHHPAYVRAAKQEFIIAGDKYRIACAEAIQQETNNHAS